MFVWGFFFGWSFLRVAYNTQHARGPLRHKGACATWRPLSPTRSREHRRAAARASAASARAGKLSLLPNEILLLTFVAFPLLACAVRVANTDFYFRNRRVTSTKCPWLSVTPASPAAVDSYFIITLYVVFFLLTVVCGLKNWN